MRADPLLPPDLEGVTAAFIAADAKFIVIGGFAVVANRHVRTTRDVDLLIAGLASLVGFKRLAGRPQDRADLAELEAIHGTLPIEPIPGLDR